MSLSYQLSSSYDNMLECGPLVRPGGSGQEEESEEEGSSTPQVSLSLSLSLSFNTIGSHIPHGLYVRI